MTTNIFRKIRKEQGYTQKQVADFLGLTGNSTVSAWEKNISFPSVGTLEKLSKLYNLPVDVFFQNQKEQKYLKTRIPVLGKIPAGVPVEMVEEIVDWEDIPKEWAYSGKEYFALRVAGDSMAPKYLEGDVLILRKQEDCESGKECVVAVNGFDATFKKVIKKESGIMLQPLNPNYEPQVFSNEDIETLPVRILGTVVELRRTIK